MCGDVWLRMGGGGPGGNVVRLEIETGESLICLEESSGSVVCWYTLLENLGDQGHACPRWLGKSGVSE